MCLNLALYGNRLSQSLRFDIQPIAEVRLQPFPGAPLGKRVFPPRASSLAPSLAVRVHDAPCNRLQLANGHSQDANERGLGLDNGHSHEKQAPWPMGLHLGLRIYGRLGLTSGLPMGTAMTPMGAVLGLPMGTIVLGLPMGTAETPMGAFWACHWA